MNSQGLTHFRNVLSSFQCKYSRALVSMCSASTWGESEDAEPADTEGKLCFVILCKELEHTQNLVSMVVLEPVPCAY